MLGFDLMRSFTQAWFCVKCTQMCFASARNNSHENRFINDLRKKIHFAAVQYNNYNL